MEISIVSGYAEMLGLVMGKILAAIAFAFFAFTLVGKADNMTSYIWYRVEPEFSRIVITEETIRGRKAVDQFLAKAREHEEKGRYHNRDYRAPDKLVVKVEKIDGHEIKTEILISHPGRLGFGGAVPSCQIRVFFDGELKVNCPIGYEFSHSLRVSKVIIHSENQNAEVVFVKDAPQLGQAWNGFESGKEVIVQERGELVLKPRE